ncbi:non-hydrolyzing UDP-N-acetylglucosamine 2-epimerase, partial [Oenococcus oeni]|uniref:non-hydrolyzing UDP-N-acetylglucosamine 2-epimerase n=1 Tax=Oenococcus oeni TaxID=1247 RepID=UPI00164916AE
FRIHYLFPSVFELPNTFKATNKLNVDPDYDLNIMKPDQNLDSITNAVLNGLEKILIKEKPDLILVHGDTTTAFTASLSAFYHHIPIGHVEAGLRTWNKYSPYPEEMNRQLIDVLSDIYFAPTDLSRQNLLKENISNTSITVTGNTAIDALKQTINENYHNDVLDLIKPSNRIILLTMHRRENHGKPMREVFRAVKEEISLHKDVEIIYPVHLSPSVQRVANEELRNVDRIHLIKPLDVVDFHNLVAKSYLIMTDSGGVQEEAPSLNKPVLVLRDTTERPEGIEAGTLKLIGTKKNKVKKSIEDLLEDSNVYNKMAQAKNPYGDGHASERILNFIEKKFMTD